MTDLTEDTAGLSAAKAAELLKKYGCNELSPGKKESFLVKTIHVICEPMFLLLIAAAAIYFLLGEPRDGIIMLVFVFGIISIDVIQEWKTDRTLNALKDLSAPHVTVIRDGIEQIIPSANLVPGDLMIIREGVKIPADGFVVRCADLSVDESSLTGEAEAVRKTQASCAHAPDETSSTAHVHDYWRADYCYAGTMVVQGSGMIRVEKTGSATEYGKIGANVASAPEEQTPLQKQTGALVRTSAIIAAALFALVCVVTWFNLGGYTFTDRLIASILSGVTLAMAMIPEEFPVILTVFLSMGAWRLAKKRSLVRKLPSVETLGAVSVLCVDKTGTITENRMTVQETWTTETGAQDADRFIETMGLGCETDAYDPMEQAMLAYCETNGLARDSLFSRELITEYPFTNELKIMGHVWRDTDGMRVAIKGSPERVFDICVLTDAEKAEAEKKAAELSAKGLRVIAIAEQTYETAGDVPASITECRPRLLGLTALSDPPREGVKEDIAVCTRAGIRVIMITGDNGVTAAAVARAVGIGVQGDIITGDMLERMSDDELREAVKHVSIFSRVIPEHKMRIVKALKANGETVAMTGDGVNDAPALKYADIGIAMGKRGSEVSREAADLILLDDNFSTIVETVKDGRRIYDNIRKAVGYVFSIHIPIAFASLLAPFLGIPPSALLLLPLHIVLLEILIDPTCSIVLERQPAEPDIMERPPRNPREKLLTGGILAKSVIQGVVIFAASFGVYAAALAGAPDNAPVARSMGLAVIIFANLFLVQVNSSERDFAFHSALRLAKDKVMWAVNAGTLALVLAILYTPLAAFLKLAALSARQLGAAFGIAAAAVLWYEAVKLVRKIAWRTDHEISDIRR